MRAFCSVFILATLALTANAFTMYQRDFTTDIQTCVTDLTAVESSLTTIKKDLKALKIKNFSASIETLSKDTDDFVRAIQMATHSCCNPAEAGELVYETLDTTSDSPSNHMTAFESLIQGDKQAVKSLERCVAERSAKDKTFKTAVAIKLNAKLDNIKSLSSDIVKKN